MAYSSLLLRRLERGHVQAYPFPYLIKENAIDESLYAKLVSEFPSLEIFTQKPETGVRYDLVADREHSQEQKKGYDFLVRHSKVWAEFLREIKSRLFVEECFDLFREALEMHNPSLLRKPRIVVKNESVPSGLRRFIKLTHRFFETLRVSVNICTIPQGPYELPPHHDTATNLFSVLFYLRSPKDKETEGGSLCLHSKIQDIQLPKKPQPQSLELYKEVTYEPNKLLMFLNTRSAYHSVSQLKPSRYPRNFIYVGILGCRNLW